MAPALVVGACLGLGIFLLVLALIPGRPSLARRLAAFDAAQLPASRSRRSPLDRGESRVVRRLGAVLARFCAEQGWEFSSLRANLALSEKVRASLAADGLQDWTTAQETAP